MTEVRLARDDEWPAVERLWQLYAHDLSEFRGSLPGSDGRFKHDKLDRGRSAGSLHLALSGTSPIGFALVTPGERGEWHMMAFFTARAVRRTGVGRDLALTAIRSHPGSWEIAFQDENPGAARFWRGLADTAFPTGWREERRPVPGKPHVPDDVWLLGTV